MCSGTDVDETTTGVKLFVVKSRDDDDDSDDDKKEGVVRDGRDGRDEKMLVDHCVEEPGWDDSDVD